MLVVGAGGFALQVLYAIQRSKVNTTPVFFCEPGYSPDPILLNSYRLIRSFEAVQEYFLQTNSSFCLGVGLHSRREELCNEFEKIGGRLENIVDSSAIVPSDFEAEIHGVSCLAQSIVEIGCSIGKGALLNLGSKVTHQVKVGDFAELGPGVQLLGKSEIGARTMIGAGAIVLPGVKVGDNVIVGAGSIVTKDLPNGVLAYGNPARIESAR
jgi:sugar O-acyltransferase (sialic acid O-acetyltransferase NeuD family)